MDPRKPVIAAVVTLASACSAGTVAAPGKPTSTVAVPAEPAPPTTQPSPSTTATTAPLPTATTGPMPATTSTSPTPAPVRAAAPKASAPAVPACPPSLASALASTGPARQIITVTATGYGTTVASVELWEKAGACWSPAGGPWAGLIGENGFSDHHTEGDGTTPTGIYGLGPEMYGNAPDPGVQEPYHQLVCGDWWDEDPRSPGYNTFQHEPCGQAPPFGGGSEALWQETAPYPSFAVIDYNTGPVVAYAGSAIFFHADTGEPTTGCVSVPLADLDLALRWLDPADHPAFVMGPASEIERF
jgi:L,D-peptidoglycan transpeptidase YkuD (ErfK/YbiS/YcfS/YnhG family)